MGVLLIGPRVPHARSRSVSIVCLLVLAPCIALVDTGTAVSASGMPWGMNVAAIAPMTEAGAKPDFAMTWVGVWNRDSWGGVQSALRTMKASGVTPVVQWYYWGDDISPACVENGCWSTLHNAQKTKADWYAMSARLAEVLRAEMGGARAIVIVETEFNKGGVDALSYAPTFDRYMTEHIATLEATPGVETIVGFGSWNQDRYTRFPDTVASADYVGLMALRSSVRETKDAYLDVVNHLMRTADAMNAKFPGKPLFVTDMAFSSYPEPEWAGHQEQVVEDLWRRVGELQAKGVRGMMYRSLTDVNMNTANYHGEAERWWGFKHQDGSAKPAYAAWLAGVGAAPPPPPPGAPVPAAFEAEAMTASTGGRISDAAASGGAAWNVWSNGSLAERVQSDAAGEFIVTVRAKGSAAAGVPAQLRVTLDSAAVGTASVTSAYADYTFTARLPAGVPAVLQVAFTNDLRTSTEDRNLVVDRVDVARAPPPNAPPVASFEAAASGLAVSVDASASSDPDGDALSYAWTFGDGTTGAGRSASHAYGADGTYAIGLTVTDGRGASATATRTVTVARPNAAPTPAFAATADALALSVDASASSDPDGDALSYAWTFGDGAGATGRTASHAYATGGTYTVTLTVTDARGLAATTARDVTANRAPLASFAFAATGLDVAFDAGASADPDGSPLAFSWDFGDGTGATGVAPAHRYAAAGTFTVRVTASDGAASATATKTVTVAPPPTPASVEAEAFATRTTGGRIADATASGGAGWNLWSNGYVAHTFVTPEGGARVVTVVARGTSAGGVWPAMEVRADGAVVGTATVATASWTAYSFLVPFDPNVPRAIAVAFTNDAATRNADRNLHVDRVTHAPVAPTVVEGEAFPVKTSGGRAALAGASGGAYWNLWSTGHVETPVSVPASGAYDLRVLARGTTAAGVSAFMVVTVDGVVVLETHVAPGAFAAYSAKVPMSAGSHAVRVAFTNDLRTSTEDRNLHVDAIVLDA